MVINPTKKRESAFLRYICVCISYAYLLADAHTYRQTKKRIYFTLCDWWRPRQIWRICFLIIFLLIYENKFLVKNYMQRKAHFQWETHTQKVRSMQAAFVWLDINGLINPSERILGKKGWEIGKNRHTSRRWITRGTETSILMICGGESRFDVGWLPEDVLPLSVLINLYDERQRGEELLTSPMFSCQSLNSSNTHTETCSCM